MALASVLMKSAWAEEMAMLPSINKQSNNCIFDFIRVQFDYAASLLNLFRLNIDSEKFQ